jgi:hypothetical protein
MRPAVGPVNLAALVLGSGLLGRRRRTLLRILTPALLLLWRAFGGSLLALRRLVILRMHPQSGSGQYQTKKTASGDATRYLHEICFLEASLVRVGVQPDFRSTYQA